MSKRLIIFGGGGFVGGNLTKIAQRKGWMVFIADSFYRPGLADVVWKTADITDEASVGNLFEEIRPDAVVNVAAVADVDRAEREKELARKINVDGARIIAENCRRFKSRHVFFSSDAVFDGKEQGYTEDSIPNPVNYYGRTKADAEAEVLGAYAEAAVIRISLVIGFPVTGGNSFLAMLESKLKEGREILCPVYEIRTPIDVITLSESVLELAGGSYSGLIHLGAIGNINRFELSKKLAAKMGCSQELVKPQIMSLQIPGRAPRHNNGILDVSKARAILKTPMLSIEDSINRAFDERI